MLRTLTVLAHAGFVVLLGCGTGAAQSSACGDAPEDVSGDFELTPEDGAEDVARNAPIVLRFAPEVDVEALATSVAGEPDGGLCAGEILCVLETEEARAIEATLERDADAGTLELVPSEPLAAETEHSVLIVQPGLDAIARAERGFRTGDSIDEERPSLPYEGSDIVVAAVTRLPAECEGPAGSRRVMLELPRAEDDADADSVALEIRMFGAYGQAEDEMLVARVRNVGNPVRASFAIDARTAAHALCVRVRAIDGVGRVAREEPELCFDPSQDVHFASGCAVGAARSTQLVEALFAMAALALAIRALRRRSGA
jgi:hypothetical protein